MVTQSALETLEGHIARDAAKGYVGPITNAEAGSDRTHSLPLVAIAVASDDDRRRLTGLLRFLNVDVVAHENLRTLRGSLLRGGVDLVITDVTLPDGNWVDVLRLTVLASSSPGILVHSRVIDDRLWSEVLWRGAYDMLIAPYSSEDGRRIIESALRAGCILAGKRHAGVKH